MIDTPTHRSTIDELSLDTVETLLVAIRERRLRALHAHDEAVRMKQNAKSNRMKARIEVEIARLSRQLLSVDKLLTKIESRYTTIRAFQLELEDTE